MTRTRWPQFAISPWSFAVLLILLTWGLRLCRLESVPPGWRDDELINIHALSGELLAGRFPLYFTGASGHEPLYHYLHAGVHAVLGFNVLSGHLLSVVFGTLTVVLTYALARSLFGRTTAVVASLALTISFWSQMYSRTAIRHISLLPFTLAAFYVFWRFTGDESTKLRITNFAKSGFVEPGLANSVLVGLLLGVSLYTYPAARVLPALLVLFLAYLAAFHHDQFRRRRRSLLVSVVIVAILAVPLGVAINQGRSEAAAQGIGADARLAELAVPLQELRAGNPRPLLETVWTTLGMFHATGDPEWLYNISNRPVFNLLGGTLLWAGVGLCLYHWRRPRYLFLLLWLGFGLLPAFVSTPPASLSHTILAQPVVYILPALALAEASRWLKSKISNPRVHSLSLLIVHHSLTIVAAVFLATNAIRDIRDYFILWPRDDMVRFLYRADHREATHYLDAHPEITDGAISSALLGPWDRLALEVDTRRDDIALRLFNPERALVWVAEDAPSAVLLTSFPRPLPPIDGLLEANATPPEVISSHLALYALSATCSPHSAIRNPLARFANGLELTEARWMHAKPLAPGQEAVLLTAWLVVTPFDLPPIPIVANPPPPGVYSGPRLFIFTHLLAQDGVLLAGDDGLQVDPLTLRPGDCFIQTHHLILPPDSPSGPYSLELGLYDPLTGERWAVLDPEGQPVADHVLLVGNAAK